MVEAVRQYFNDVVYKVCLIYMQFNYFGINNNSSSFAHSVSWIIQSVGLQSTASGNDFLASRINEKRRDI